MSDDGFGAHPFALGVEEELLRVDPVGHGLVHTAIALLDEVGDGGGLPGSAHPDTYAAEVELVSPVSADAAQAVAALAAWRERMQAAGGVLLGAGIHPDAAHGDVVHAPGERYEAIHAEMRGLVTRTPTCALHVHVGMPDRETALATFNGLRAHLPDLQALAANSPFWFGQDSGMDSSRALLFRGYPRAEVPRAYDSWDDYETSIAAATAAAQIPDYTFLWWDLRPHPRLGTIEVRAMDAQAPLWVVEALAALVHGLARAEAESGGASGGMPREALMEGSFRAARDGLRASVWDGEGHVPVPELVARSVALAAPHVGADALEGVARILAEGNGADRQRAAFRDGGMAAVLAGLVADTRVAAAPAQA